MPTFPTRDWMREFCGHLAVHPDAKQVAEALDGDYRFVIDPAGPLEERHSYDVRIAPAEGADAGRPEVRLLDGGDGEVQPTLELIANHDRWRQLIKGELDVGMALMLRRVKVRGDTSRLIGRLGSSKTLMGALGQVQTEWLDE